MLIKVKYLKESQIFHIGMPDSYKIILYSMH